MQKNTLLVDDDEVMRSNYTELLSGQGFRVAAFGDFQSAMHYAHNTQPDLALLDTSLRGDRDTGLQLCADLRRLAPRLPIIFLTDHDSEQEKISGMRAGADDYLAKNTSTEYLIIRIEALLRRFEALTKKHHGPAPGETALLQRGDLRIDQHRQIIHWRRHKVELTLAQFWIVNALAANPGQEKTLGQLMRAANLYVEPNTVAAHIRNIRQCFRIIDPDFNCIKTERGIGYRWMDD